MNVNTTDFNNDWLRIVKSELVSEGYDITNLTDEKISISYFSLEKRRITQQPRQVLKSVGFSCPIYFQKNLNIIEEKIKKGDDIKPYLSRKLKNLDEKDNLLFDWGIHHLHLGNIVENDGFIKRTQPLLYVRFDNHNAYFIGIFNHGDWTKQAMIKTIHDNWPESIEQYRIKEAISLGYKVKDSEIKYLREAKFNYLIEIESGVVYMGLGWGITGSGDSAEALGNHLDRLRGLSELERKIKENTSEILISVFHDLSFIKNQNLEFELVRKSGKFYVYEKNNGFYITLRY